MRLNRFMSSLGALALAAAFSACGGGGARPEPVAAPSHGGGADVAKAIKALNEGDPARARALLSGVLQHDPRNAIAQKLLVEIDADPVKLFGADSYPYVVQSGDTMASLSARFLGTPLLAYALSRYNGIAVPASLAAGRTLRIPGKEKPVARPRPEPTPAEHKHVAPAQTAPAPSPVPKPASPPAAPTTNPARAAQLRARGLEQMNRGAIAPAVALLGEASRLDPGNALIRRDLERALRIQQAVRAKP